MTKTKTTDEDLKKIISENPNTSNRQICLQAGLTPSGPTNVRIDRLKRDMGINPVLRFADIKAGDRLLRAGKRLIVTERAETYIEVQAMDGSVKKISRGNFSKTAHGYTRIPPDVPQGGPVTTYYIEPGTEPGASNNKNPAAARPASKEAEPPRRDYLDKIDQLLSVVMPDCETVMLDEVINLAVKMLASGIREEVEYDYP